MAWSLCGTGAAMRGYALRCARGYHGPVCVRAAGRAWHREGRYGRLIGRPPAEGLSVAEAIRQDGERGDHLKIVNSGLNSLTEYGRTTAPQFDLAEMSAAVKAAAERGLSVMVHANGEEPVRIAVMSGCRSVEHGFFMGRENLARMAEQGSHQGVYDRHHASLYRALPADRNKSRRRPPDA